MRTLIYSLLLAVLPLCHIHAQEAKKTEAVSVEKKTEENPEKKSVKTVLGKKIDIDWGEFVIHTPEWNMRPLAIQHEDNETYVVFAIGDINRTPEVPRFIVDYTLKVKVGDSFTVTGPPSRFYPGGPSRCTFTLTEVNKDDSLVTIEW